MLVKIMASLVVAREKTYGCYGTNMQKMRRKNFFETRFELFGCEMGQKDVKKNSSAYLPHVPSPPDSDASLACWALFFYEL